MQAGAPAEAAAPAQAAQAPVISAAPETQPDDGGASITAPMVGVFYAAASPDAQPYVTVGSSVKKGDVICIIEAMKLMNEITATQSGTITVSYTHLDMYKRQPVREPGHFYERA